MTTIEEVRTTIKKWLFLSDDTIIDVILATPSLAARLVESDVDYDLRGIDKPSDHAPFWSTFKEA